MAFTDLKVYLLDPSEITTVSFKCPSLFNSQGPCLRSSTNLWETLAFSNDCWIYYAHHQRKSLFSPWSYHLRVDQRFYLQMRIDSLHSFIHWEGITTTHHQGFAVKSIDFLYFASGTNPWTSLPSSRIAGCIHWRNLDQNIGDHLWHCFLKLVLGSYRKWPRAIYGANYRRKISFKGEVSSFQIHQFL